MGEIDERISTLERAHKTTATRLDRVEQCVRVLRQDMGEIKEAQKHAATKEDLASLRGDISEVRGLVHSNMRDALAAVPARQMVLWSAILAVLTAIGILAPLLLRD